MENANAVFRMSIFMMALVGFYWLGKELVLDGLRLFIVGVIPMEDFLFNE